MREHTSSPEHQAQREIVAELLKPRPTIIAIEGGPCSGKTTLIEQLQRSAGNRQVVCLPEAATQHILRLQGKGVDIADIEQNDRGAWLAFEKDVLGSIVKNLETAREVYAGTDAVIVTDRADIGAYVTADEYGGLLRELGLDVPPILTHVDQVYYLPSLARIDAPLYEQISTNNPARLESVEKAATVCERTLAVVGNHPELHVAWGGEFDTTIAQLTESILYPENESEVKLKPRLERPDAVERYFGAADTVSVALIEQTYYELEGTVFRLRRTATKLGGVLHTFTVKHGEGIHRREIQRSIDMATFQQLSQCQRVGETLVKERSTVLLPDGGSKKRAWALDRYFDRRLPEWNVETDVESEQEARGVHERMTDFEFATLGAEKLARSLGARSLQVR